MTSPAESIGLRIIGTLRERERENAAYAPNCEQKLRSHCNKHRNKTRHPAMRDCEQEEERRSERERGHEGMREGDEGQLCRQRQVSHEAKRSSKNRASIS